LESEDQKLWLRAKAAYPGDGPDHPPDEEGGDTPGTNILRFLCHINNVALSMAFESLVHLTANLPRAGVPDVAPLLAMTDELGTWMRNALELPPSGRSVT
jgi:hypothetical protein